MAACELADEWVAFGLSCSGRALPFTWRGRRLCRVHMALAWEARQREKVGG